jgi:DNA ligase-1
MRLAELVAVSRAVGDTPGRLEKISLLADLLARTPAQEIAVIVAFLTGEPRQGRLGIGGAQLAAMRSVRPAADATLDVREVDSTFNRLMGATGPGSMSSRAQLLASLLGRATADEQDFLVRLLFGELRQGALEGVLMEAIARASNALASQIRRAAMLAGDLGEVARVAIAEGADALTRFILRPFQPVQPMLADSAADLGSVLADLGEASFEYKLDGARIQVHKVDDEVRVFSRNLRDLTVAVPEVVAIARGLPFHEAVLDGEAIALRPDGTPRPFQLTMRRFGRKREVNRLREELPITPFFFDVLFVDGSPLVDEPLARRVAILEERVASVYLVPRLVTSSPEEASAFRARAVTSGHEGVMAKALDAPYASGRRGSAWLKVKEARTLDLVVLAAEWGNGRRRGLLSNLHLGARDETHGGFVMIGKTFKGLTDEMLAWQTRRFLDLEIGRDDYAVHVRPEVVVEIAFNEIQASPQYAGGVVLRFARVKRYRPDKTAAETDTIARIQAMHRREAG